MKRALFSFLFVVAAAVAFSASAFAQRNVTPAVERDPVLEADAKHNLEVARNAFLLKKAYKGVLMRFEETFAAYPDFSKMDEFLYYAGMSSYYLAEGKGKQKIDLRTEKDKAKYAPEKLREDAIAYLSMLIDKYPQSKYLDEAQKALGEIKQKAASSQTN
ncbi:MAG: outer membrane protein assembly factor BamD [Pyrinomonadaceae bacterium]